MMWNMKFITSNERYKPLVIPLWVCIVSLIVIRFCLNNFRFHNQQYPSKLYPRNFARIIFFVNEKNRDIKSRKIRIFECAKTNPHELSKIRGKTIENMKFVSRKILISDDSRNFSTFSHSISKIPGDKKHVFCRHSVSGPPLLLFFQGVDCLALTINLRGVWLVSFSFLSGIPIRYQF